MDYVLHAGLAALSILLTPAGLGHLLLGVFLGLLIGLIPGLGGIIGLSLLLPFTFDMSPHAAIATLMGMAAAVSHADVIPAILFGVPGTVGCQATVMDGYPLTKRGEAGRALGAAFTASLLGGLFGATVLALVIPIIRPVILFFGSPELLAICIFGISLVASLSGNAPLKGMAAASVGLLLSMVGQDPQLGTPRFTFGLLYLLERLPIVPVALGIFAVPEICDLMIRRAVIATGDGFDATKGQWLGCKEAFVHWFLVLRTAALGATCGVVPGLGAPVIDWIAYTHAMRTEEGAAASFGHGDVRGVIAAESSTNAREGGALIPTVAFGVPANPSMAILLGAFLIQGLVPGPDMLTKHLDVTYTFVWSLALANVLGTATCFALAGQLARIVTISYVFLVPVVTVLIFLGGLEGQHSWGDIIALLALGLFGWMMKQCGWPRPPFVLGFILGSLLERYTAISITRYGWTWLGHGFVLTMLALSALSLLRRLVRVRRGTFATLGLSLRRPRWSLGAGLVSFVLLVFLCSLPLEAQWPLEARLMPQAISVAGTFFCALLLAAELFRAPLPQASAGAPGSGIVDAQRGYGNLSQQAVHRRAAWFFSWAVGFLALAYGVGFLPSLFFFVLGFIWLQARAPFRVALATAAGLFCFIWIVFDRIISEPWPSALVGDLFPQLRDVLQWF